jgi:transcriptional regulator with XRE-family HTH domain
MHETHRIVSSIKAGRGALSWSQKQLASQAQVSLVTLARLEAGLAAPQAGTIGKLRAALESYGVFISDNTPLGGYTLTVVQEESALHSSINLTNPLQL